MKQLKEDIVQAKKFEYDLKRQMTRSIEDEYLKKLYDYKYNNNEHEERERLKQYHERLAFIQMRAEEKMRMEMKRAEEYEIQKLNIDQEALLKSEMQRMMNRRYLFHESERARELLEQKGLPMASQSSPSHSPRSSPGNPTNRASSTHRTPRRNTPTRVP